MLIYISENPAHTDTICPTPHAIVCLVKVISEINFGVVGKEMLEIAGRLMGWGVVVDNLSTTGV